MKNIKLLLGLMTLASTSSIQAQNCGGTKSSDNLVSYEFNQIELKDAVTIASMAAGKTIIGAELLENKTISAAAKQVNVVAFVDALLLVNGFHFEEQADSWVITKM